MKIQFEFNDGSLVEYEVADQAEVWQTVHSYDRDEIASAWRDGEPWFGLCTDMREGQP